MSEGGRQERRRRAREQKKAPRRRRGSTLFGVIVGVLVVGGAGLVFLARTNPPAAPEPPEGVRTFEDVSADHVNGPVNYPQEPPVGGPHAGTPLTCGFYSQPVPAENAVHSLEHGAIWITYRPDLPEEGVARLRGFAGTKVLVSPWPGNLPAPVVASAWARQLHLDGPDDPDLPRFIDAFRGGSQSPEPAAPCSGVGQPG